MLINDLVSLLMQIPPMLAGGWGLWFFAGLLLSIWQRKERARLIVHGPTPRTKSGVRPPAKTARPASRVAPAGDAFSELEAVLDDTGTGGHRRPGDRDARILTETPRPLAAPQSLP